MYKTTVKIEGMVCSMCQAHVCDAIRNAFPQAKKVAASVKRGEATFLTEALIEEENLKAAVEPTGYKVLSVSSEVFQKRGLFGL